MTGDMTLGSVPGEHRSTTVTMLPLQTVAAAVAGPTVDARGALLCTIALTGAAQANLGIDGALAADGPWFPTRFVIHNVLGPAVVTFAYAGAPVALFVRAYQAGSAREYYPYLRLRVSAVAVPGSLRALAVLL